MKKRIIPKSMWKIAFWMSWLVLGVVSYLVVPAWWEMMDSYGSGPKWVSLFHPFPVSLFLSLIVWLYFRAFRGSVRYTKGWLIAFFVNCVPGGALYALIVNESLSLRHLGAAALGMPPVYLLLLNAAASFLLCMQVMFAILSFRKRSNESSKSMHDQVRKTSSF